MVIQAALLVAVHAQPLAVVTLTLPVDAVNATLAVSGDTVKLHGAACVIRTRWLLIVIVP